MKLWSLVYFIPAAFLVSSASAQYSTGFENPPFVPADINGNPGDISGQDSWTTNQNPSTARVLTATDIATELTNVGLSADMPVHGGAQALLVSGAGLNNATIRVISGLEIQNNVVLDVWARPLTGGSTGNIFLTMEDSAGDRAAAFRFGVVGGQQTIDYGTAVANPWLASGALWDSNTWYRLTMSLDYGTKTYDFAINGLQVNSSPISFYTAASDNLSQVRIFRGAGQSGMIVDDLTVTIPEPGAMAFLVLGGTAALLRRNRNSARHTSFSGAL